MALRPYQDRAIVELRAAYASGKRAPVLVLPTGAGKTVVASEIIRSSVAKGKRVLFLAHRYELLSQTITKLEASGVTDVRLIQAATDLGNPIAPVAVASVQTLTTKRWLDRLPKADLVVCDEAHHFVAKTFARITDAYPSALLLGLTATPQRGDGKPLGDVFDALVVGSTVNELTELGHLVQCRVWAPAGDMETGRTALGPAEAYDTYADGQRAVIFCASREHATEVVASMRVPTEIVHGNMSMASRTDVLRRFRAGELRAVANVHVLSEGFDDPAIAVCILARKMGHAGTFLQAVGRILRPAPGKESAILIDLCGSVLKHGTPDAEREFTLDGKGISSSGRDQIRQCPSCGFVFEAAAVDCPECGAALPRKKAALPVSDGTGLVEVAGPVAPRPPFTVALTAKFAGKCTGCTAGINVGERIYWTKGTKPRHAQCGVQLSAIDIANELMRKAGS